VLIFYPVKNPIPVKPKKSPASNVTMADIAREVGVTPAAVSLALKDNPRVSEARRKQIQAAAERMGYRPNAMATSLAYHRHDSRSIPTEAGLAWLNGWPEPEKLQQLPQFAAYWKGASRAAQKFGYRLDEFVVTRQMTLSRIEKILRARNISGILIPPHAGMEVPWQELNWDRFSVVRFGLTARNLPSFHSVTADQSGNAFLAFMKMKEKGYKRIGFAGVSEKEWRGLAGFSQAQFSVPVSQRVPPLLHRFWEGPENLEKPLRWLKKYRPDAILIEHGQFFLQIKPLGFEVPRDFGLATTVIPDCPLDSGIDQNPEEIGRAAVLVLLSQIRDNARGVPPISRLVLIEGTWVDGKSLPSVGQDYVSSRPKVPKR
jgi:DNA-binding LacI/PurR family transcriptional regulator